LTTRNSPLISADDLHGLIGSEHIRIADVRWYLNRPEAGRAAYAEGHVPTAVFVDLDEDLADHDGLGAPGRHPLPSPQAFAARMGELGFGSDDLIVAYDDVGGSIAARMWWMLDNLGHSGGAAVLDGGVQAWRAAGYDLSSEEVMHPPRRMKLRTKWTNVIERDDLARRLGALTLLDARSPERYRGEVEPIDPVAGHIPTAVSAPVNDNLDAKGRMKTADELRAAYRPLLEDGRPTVVACGSGTTACHDILALRVAGLPEPILYVGSYSDWSRSGMPIATGSDPG